MIQTTAPVQTPIDAFADVVAFRDSLARFKSELCAMRPALRELVAAGVPSAEGLRSDIDSHLAEPLEYVEERLAALAAGVETVAPDPGLDG